MSLLPIMRREQERLAVAELKQSNALSERFGLSLSDGEIENLVKSRFDALADTGRIEMGEGVIKKLVYAFCDSPYITRDEYAETLAELQDVFYALKNESEDMMSDDELIEAMAALFNGRAGGSLEYMEDVTFGELCRAARGGRYDE